MRTGNKYTAPRDQIVALRRAVAGMGELSIGQHRVAPQRETSEDRARRKQRVVRMQAAITRAKKGAPFDRWASDEERQWTADSENVVIFLHIAPHVSTLRGGSWDGRESWVVTIPSSVRNDVNLWTGTGRDVQPNLRLGDDLTRLQREDKIKGFIFLWGDGTHYRPYLQNTKMERNHDPAVQERNHEPATKMEAAEDAARRQILEEAAERKFKIELKKGETSRAAAEAGKRRDAQWDAAYARIRRMEEEKRAYEIVHGHGDGAEPVSAGAVAVVIGAGTRGRKASFRKRFHVSVNQGAPPTTWSIGWVRSWATWWSSSNYAGPLVLRRRLVATDDVEKTDWTLFQ